jgi:hypothetical protein
VVSANSAGGFSVTGSHTYAEEGSYAVSVQVNDAGGATASAGSAAAMADAPLTATGIPVAATEGSAFSGVVATFTDANPNAPSNDFMATITWGDGSTSAGTITANASGGFSVTGSHTYAEEGSYAAGVQINDLGGASTGASTAAAVADAALTASAVKLTATEGSAFTGVVATFTDADPGAAAGDFTASITWGDGHSSPGTVSANPAGGFIVTATNTYAEESSYTVSVQISDAGGATASTASTATVADAALTASGTSVTATEGSAFSGVVATFSDADPGATSSDFTATITWGDGQSSPGTVSATSAGGFTVTGSHTYTDEGSYAVSVQVNDAGGALASAGLSAAVADAALTTLGVPVAATEGSSFTGVAATFTDANPGATAADFTATITWGDGHTSAGTVSANGAGGFSVSGTNTYAEEGSYGLGVQVTDVGGATAGANSTAAVADAALTATPAPVSAAEGSTFTGFVAGFTDGNPAAAASDFTATITWGDGHTSLGTVSANAAGGFTVTGTYTYAQEGSYAVSVQISDAGGASASAASTATVADATLTASGTSVTAAERQSFSGLVATFTDANPNATAGELSATITWGDGNTSAGTITASTSGGFSVTGSHTYAEGGSYAVGVQIMDAGGASASAASTAAVADLPLTATGTAVKAKEGQAFSGVVATFTDAEPNTTGGDYTAVITWGDGSVSAGTVHASSRGGFTVTGTHTFEEGSFAVRVQITDAGGATATANTTATVTDQRLTATAAPVKATEGSAFSGVVATFTDANPNATASDFTATITWGNGHTSAGTVSANSNGGFTVTGTNVYAEQGQYTVSVQIQDVGRSSARTQTRATVADAALTATTVPVAAVKGQPFNGPVATFVDANPSAPTGDFTATISWGDGHTSTGTVVVDPEGGWEVQGTHTYTKTGSYTVTVTIRDRGASKVVVSELVSVV